MRGPTGFRLGLLAVLVLLVSGIAWLAAKAAVLNEDSLRADIASRLAAWTGGAVEISGPIHLHYFPGISLTTGKFRLSATPNLPYLRGVKAKALKVKLGLWSLLSSQAQFNRIVLIEPEIPVVTADGGRSAPPAEAATLLKALRLGPVPEIRLVNGIIIAAGPHAREKITGLDADLTMDSESGRFAAGGQLKWRGQPLTFEFAARQKKKRDEQARMSIKLSLKGPLLDADVVGESTIADKLRVAGTLDLKIVNLRRFGRWLGLLIPDGHGLGPFTATGPFYLRGHRIGFDDGTFSLDGNRSLGALAVEFGGARPQIEGTLAFSTIDLGQYIRAAPQAPPAGKTGTAPTPRPVAVNFPLLHHLDLDLRLSASEVTTPVLALGQTALSVASKSGRLVADFAILDMCGGNGNGRLTFDAALPDTQYRLNANMTGVDARRCIERIAGQSPVSAALALTIDLTSKGRTADEVLQGLGGKVMVKAGAGEIRLDLTDLASRPAFDALNGWAKAMTKTAAFERAKAELIFRQGTIFGDQISLVSGESEFSGEGTIDLVNRRLDLRLNVGKTAKPGPAGQQAPAPAAPARVVIIRGPWSQPALWVEDLQPKKASETAGAPERTARQ